MVIPFVGIYLKSMGIIKKPTDICKRLVGFELGFNEKIPKKFRKGGKSSR
jgi:hypothetical protein